MYNNLDEKNYKEYLKKINDIYSQDDSLEICIHLLFTVKNDECLFSVTKMENDYNTELLSGLFKYNDTFKKEFLIPAIVGFSKRNPLNTVEISPNPRKTSIYFIRSYSKDKNILSVENISKEFALQIENNIKKIPAVYYENKKTDIKNNENNDNYSEGFAGIVSLSIITVLVCIIIGIILTLELF